MTNRQQVASGDVAATRTAPPGCPVNAAGQRRPLESVADRERRSAGSRGLASGATDVPVACDRPVLRPRALHRFALRPAVVGDVD